MNEHTLAETKYPQSTLDAMETMAMQTIDGLEQLAELNLGVARDLSCSLLELTRMPLQSKEPTEMMVAHTTAMQSLMGIGTNYGSQLIALATQNLPEFVKVFETHLANVVPNSNSAQEQSTVARKNSTKAHSRRA